MIASLFVKMNAIAQIERAFDGTLWGLTSTTQESMPTVAGVWERE